jgi:hypothetical protein
MMLLFLKMKIKQKISNCIVLVSGNVKTTQSSLFRNEYVVKPLCPVIEDNKKRL